MREFPRRSRWRWVFAFWVIEAVLVQFFAVQVTTWEESKSWSERLVAPFAPEVLHGFGPFVLMVIAGQGVLLLPARFPRREGESGFARAAARIACGLGAATVVQFLIWGGVFLSNTLGCTVKIPDTLLHGTGSLLLALGVTITVAFVLKYAYPDGVPAIFQASLAGLAGAILCAALIASAFGVVSYASGGTGDLDARPVLLALSLTFLCTWGVATPFVLSLLRRPDGMDRIACISRWVLGGTIVHFAALIPLDVMVRRRSNCHCETATFWSLLGTLGIGAFALGPVVFLLPFNRRRAALRRGICFSCGYDLRSLPAGTRCPECGLRATPPLSPESSRSDSAVH
jgi:hypothetical protein